MLFWLFISSNATVQHFSENIDIYYIYNNSVVKNYFTISDTSREEVKFLENPNVNFLNEIAIKNKMNESHLKTGVFVFHTSSLCMNSFLQKDDLAYEKKLVEELVIHACAQSYVEKVSDSFYKYYLLKMYWVFKSYF